MKFMFMNFFNALALLYSQNNFDRFALLAFLGWEYKSFAPNKYLINSIQMLSYFYWLLILSNMHLNYESKIKSNFYPNFLWPTINLCIRFTVMEPIWFTIIELKVPMPVTNNIINDQRILERNFKIVNASFVTNPKNFEQSFNKGNQLYKRFFK